MHLIFDCFFYWDDDVEERDDNGEMKRITRQHHRVAPLEIELDNIACIASSFGPDDMRNKEDMCYSRIFLKNSPIYFDLDISFEKLQSVWRKAIEKQCKRNIQLKDN